MTLCCIITSQVSYWMILRLHYFVSSPDVSSFDEPRSVLRRVPSARGFDGTCNRLARIQHTTGSQDWRRHRHRTRWELVHVPSVGRGKTKAQCIQPLYDFILIFIGVVFVLFLVGWSGAQSSWNAWVWRDHDPSASRSHRFASMKLYLVFPLTSQKYGV